MVRVSDMALLLKVRPVGGDILPAATGLEDQIMKRFRGQANAGVHE